MKPACYLVPKDIEISAPGVTVNCQQLGFPDLKLFRKNFQEWITEPENLKYFYNIVPCLGDEGNKVVSEVLIQEKQKFGFFEDSILGLKQMINNIPYIENSIPLEAIDIKCDYALSIMAGPSADDLIPKLKDHLKTNPGVLILACDAIYRRLLNEGIDPHFVFTSERGIETKKFFDNLPKKSRAHLVCSQFSCMPPLLAGKVPSSFIIGLRPETHYLFPEELKFPYNPGVAELPAVFAWLKDFDNLGLIGTDFCFKNSQTSHAKLGADSDDAVLPSKNGPHTEIIDIKGQTRLTTPIYKLLHNTLSETLNRLPLKFWQWVDSKSDHQPAKIDCVDYTNQDLPKAPNPVQISIKENRKLLKSQDQALFDQLDGQCNISFLFTTPELSNCVLPLFVAEWVRYQSKLFSGIECTEPKIDLSLIRRVVFGSLNNITKEDVLQDS